MLIVWGVPICAEVRDILEDIKVDYPYLFQKIKPSGRNIMMPCPFHSGGQERNPSFGIRKDTGIAHCFTADCDWRGDLPKLIQDIYNLPSITEGYKWLIKRYNVPEPGNRAELPIDEWISRDKQGIEYLPEAILRNFDYRHPYLYQRGMTDDILDFFDIGFNPNNNAVVFPIRDRMGRLRLIQERPLLKSIRYKNDETPKIDLVFGLDVIQRALRGEEGLENVRKKIEQIGVFMTEGIFDSLSCWQMGYPSGGIMGAIPSKEQIKEIQKAGVRKIVKFFDNDKAGWAAGKKLEELGGRNLRLYEAIYPKKVITDRLGMSRPPKDPNDLLLYLPDDFANLTIQ